jgi:hypothetical protein
MPTPKQLANLKPARKGEVRNPNGRPPGSKNWASIAREMLEDPEHIIKGLRHNGKPVTKKYPAKVLLEVLMTMAASGNIRAFHELRVTAYGNGNPSPDPLHKQRQLEEWFEETFPPPTPEEQAKEMAEWARFELWKTEEAKKAKIYESQSAA